MYPGIVIGTVVCSVKTPELTGVRLLLVQPTDWEKNPDGDPLVAGDSVGANRGEMVFYVQAREAAVTLPSVPALDAAIVAIIDALALYGEKV